MSDIKNIKIDDGIGGLKDNVDVKRSYNKKPKFHTEVTFKNELGETLFTTHNELVLSGGLFLFEKIGNTNAPINIQTANIDLGILPTEVDPGFKGPRREAGIFGFVLGLGGCTDVFDTVKPVKYKERKVEAMIPFRKVPKTKDLTSAERNKYFMRKENNGYYDYYIKRFEAEPVIKAEFDEPGFPAVPPNVDEMPDDKVINTYIQFTLKVTRDDMREYFKVAGGGLNKARINSLGLVYGYPDTSLGYNEYKGVRLFSKLNMNNEPLDNETKELNIVYKIYI